MTEDAIVAELADLCGLLNATHARLVALVGEVLQGKCWAGAGIHSCEQWVSWRTGLSPARAGQVVTMARRRVDLPETFAAFEAGELSVDQVAVVARHTPAPYDHDVAAFARAATVVQLRRTLGRYRFGDDAADPVERPDPIHVSRRYDDDGHYRLSARLDADDGAVVDAALEEAHDALFNAGDVDATWSDALVEMARRSLGAVSSLARRDSFTVYLHLPTDHGHAYLHGGPALPDALARQLLCDSRGAIVGLRNSTAVNVGRTRRIVPSHTRRTVEDRDRGCRVPGCTRRHGEIHHIVHWLDHGPTDTANLVVLCHRHHRLHHQGGLGIQGNADQPGGLTFTDRRGRPVPRAPAPTAPTAGCAIPVAGHWSHPTGERLQTHWIDFSRQLPRPG